MLMPIFKDGRLIAWSAMFGHMTDVGGKVPGSLPTDAARSTRKASCVPPIKIYQGGELQEDLLKVILHNCRLPTGTARTSTPSSRRCALRRSARASRSRPLRRRHVLSRRWTRCSSATSARCAQLIRQTVPEKKQYFEDYICDDGMDMGPYKIACTMWREGDKCIFDFDGHRPAVDLLDQLPVERRDVQDVLRAST